MSHLEDLRQELSFRKNEAREMLLIRYDEKEIAAIVNALSSVGVVALSDKVPLEYCLAAVSLAQFQFLEDNMPPAPDLLLSAECAANLVLAGVFAGMTLAEAGGKPSERPAYTRLKQLQNQPHKRVRENAEQDDIREYFDQYVETKGGAPKALSNFLKFLPNDFTIDDMGKSLDRPGTWEKPKSFKTLERWMNEFKKSQ